MNRRGFLQTVGALVAVHGLNIRTGCDLHRLLGGWVDPTRLFRYDLTTPWVADGFAYASDGRALARMTSLDEDTNADTRHLPKGLLELWRGFWHERGRWLPLPRTYKKHRTYDGECYLCQSVDCEACHGEGEVTREMLRGQWWVEICEACLGRGYRNRPECPHCHGRHDAWASAEFGDKLIGIRYANELRRIPGVTWNVGGCREEPILWKSDIGIAGLILPRVT